LKIKLAKRGWVNTLSAAMSTSHYSSRPFRGLQPPTNKRRWTAAKLATITGLLILDLVVLINSTDIVESCAVAALVIVNLWALTATK
jgi:hypothetical protein